jgi:ribonuclease HI
MIQHSRKNPSADQVLMHTDGASRGNPGPGGYGTILSWLGHEKELSAGYRLTTNNRMELMAVIAGLEALRRDGLQVIIYSDSQYVVRAIREGWLKNWIATGFKGGKKNQDLWLRYEDLARRHQLTLHWVKGHADNPQNNRCDELATAAADGPDLLIDAEFEKIYRTNP